MLKQEMMLRITVSCHPDCLKGKAVVMLDLPEHCQGDQMRPHAARNRDSTASLENFKVKPEVRLEARFPGSRSSSLVRGWF